MALFDIEDDKATGLDGYFSAFFKTSWETTRSDLCNTVKEFFANGKFLKHINHTIITLIPKVSHNAHVHDSRPITYCNILYKIITKILVDLMPKLLFHVQSVFVKGRNITDNIFFGTRAHPRNILHNKRPPNAP